MTGSATSLQRPDDSLARELRSFGPIGFLATTGRIFLAMAAHAAFNLTALAIIYWTSSRPSRT